MISWVKRKLWQWAEQGRDLEDENQLVNFDNSYDSTLSNSPKSDPTMSFKVYSAVGGRIVEFRMFDSQQDKYEHKLYVISDEEDFGDSIKKIAVLNALST
jgi:hypothetical protein